MSRFSRCSLLIAIAPLVWVGCGEKKSPEVLASHGTSLDTAAKVCGPQGQAETLASLACPGDEQDGSSERLGSLGPDADGHMIDHFQVRCPDGSQHDLFLDLYHCDDPDEAQAISGLTLRPPPPPPEIKPWQPGPDGIPLAQVAQVPEHGVLLVVASVGAEPRQKVRYHPQVGQTEGLRMRMMMAMEMTIAGISNGKMTLPPMLMDMEMTVTEVSGHEIAYDVAVTQATVDRSGETGDFPPEILIELETSLQPLEGMTGYARITDRGESLEAEFVLPADAPPELEQQMASFSNSAQNLASPMPAEAIGVGATWSVYSLIDSNGFKIVQRADFEVVAMEGDQIELDITLFQQPLDANPQMSTLPPGTEMEMLRFSSLGTGHAYIDTALLVPMGSEATVEMSFGFSMLTEGQTIEAAMGMDMTMKLTPLE
jgi:hypothetical protein